jgi:hypothetical protein
LNSTIKNQNFPLDKLVDLVSQYDEKLLGPNLVVAMPIAGMETFRLLAAMHEETNKNLVALTLLHWQQQRKNQILLCDATMVAATSAAAYIATCAYFYERFRQPKFIVPCSLLDAGTLAYSYYKKSKIKATPKRTLSEAVKHVLPDARNPENIEWLKPAIKADNPFSKAIKDLEASDCIFEIFGHKSDVQEVKDANIKVFEGRIGHIKGLYKIARDARDIDAVLRLAGFLESAQRSLKNITE